MVTVIFKCLYLLKRNIKIQFYEISIVRFECRYSIHRIKQILRPHTNTKQTKSQNEDSHRRHQELSKTEVVQFSH